jgi:hypothetical protein
MQVTLRSWISESIFPTKRYRSTPDTMRFQLPSGFLKKLMALQTAACITFGREDKKIYNNYPVDTHNVYGAVTVSKVILPTVVNYLPPML